MSFMSKKSQTTGQPRRRRRSGDAPEMGEVQNKPQNTYKRRAEREAEIQKYIVWGTTITVGVIIAVIAIALLIDQIIIPNQAVANVSGENITVSEFRERVKFERARLIIELSQLQQAGFDLEQISQQEPWKSYLNEVNFPDQLGQRVINDMVNDVLVRQEADARDIQVNDEAVQEQINTYFAFDPTQVALIGVEPTATEVPTETPTPFVSPTPTSLPTSTPTLSPDETQEVLEPTITPQPTVISPTLTGDEVRDNFQQSQDAFRSAISSNGGVGGGAIDKYWQRQALSELLKNALFGDKETLSYVNARHILVDTEEKALEIIDALDKGESFADLAAASSSDGSASRGGELGWAYIGNYVDEFRTAAETAEIGEIVGPVKTEFGYHVLQVRAREERSGEENESELENAKSRDLQKFIEDLRTEKADSIQIYDNWIDYVPR